MCPDCGLSDGHFRSCPQRKLAERLHNRGVPIMIGEALAVGNEARATMRELGFSEATIKTLDNLANDLQELAEMIEDERHAVD